METKTIEVSIKGIAPLLMHRMTGESGKPDPNIEPREIAEKVIYKDANGLLYQPAEHLQRTIEKASTEFPFKGKGKKTYKEYVQAGILITPDFIIHKIQKWEPDEKWVNVQRSKILRIRPRLDEWELDFIIEVGDPKIELSVLNDILIYAGRHKGIGDFRPRYGRFMITKFKLIK